jgi:hypothetical protein
MTNKPFILVGFVRIEIEDCGSRRVVDSVAMVGFSGCGCGMEVLVVGVVFVEEGMR